MSPGSPLEAAERSLGQVVVPVGRSDTFGAADRPAPRRRDVTRPGGPSIHRPDACPSSAGARRGRASRRSPCWARCRSCRLLLPGTGRVIDRSLAMPMMRRLRRGRCVDVRATAGVRAIRRRVLHGLGLDDGVSLRLAARPCRIGSPAMARRSVDRWPGRAAGAWRSKPAQAWLWAVRSGPCWVRTSVSRSELRSASRRATVCSSAGLAGRFGRRLAGRFGRRLAGRFGRRLAGRFGRRLAGRAGGRGLGRTPGRSFARRLGRDRCG